MSVATGAVVPPEMEKASREAHYSPAFWTRDTLLISGQTGVDDEGRVPDSRADEAREAFERMKTVLEHAGLTLGDVAMITSYHVGDASDIHVWFAPVKDDYFGEPWPAWTAVGVQSLADAHARVEISAIAVRPVTT